VATVSAPRAGELAMTGRVNHFFKLDRYFSSFSLH
jgi:hypothetical protein